MSTKLEEKIYKIIELKKGNKELALFYDGENEWTFSLGNPSSSVMLGESSGEMEVNASTLEGVVNAISIIIKV